MTQWGDSYLFLYLRIWSQPPNMVSRLYTPKTGFELRPIGVECFRDAAIFEACGTCSPAAFCGSLIRLFNLEIMQCILAIFTFTATTKGISYCHPMQCADPDIVWHLEMLEVFTMIALSHSFRHQ